MQLWLFAFQKSIALVLTALLQETKSKSDVPLVAEGCDFGLEKTLRKAEGLNQAQRWGKYELTAEDFSPTNAVPPPSPLARLASNASPRNFFSLIMVICCKGR